MSEKKNPRVSVLDQLIGLARLIRRRDDPAEAVVAGEYEQQFAADLARAKGAPVADPAATSTGQ
jgi:hypothetical protein